MNILVLERSTRINLNNKRLDYYIKLYHIQFLPYWWIFFPGKNRSFIEICIPTYFFMNYIAMASYHVFKYIFKN